MNNIWQLQEAKNRFSELVKKAHKEGPQIVTKFGKKSVVVLSVTDYKKFNRHKEDILSFFRNSPLYNLNINLDRDKDVPRKIEL